MRCDGIRTATKETCGSLLYRCKDCAHQGCNQAVDGVCSAQGFKSTRCKACNKMATSRLVKDADPAQATG